MGSCFSKGGSDQRTHPQPNNTYAKSSDAHTKPAEGGRKKSGSRRRSRSSSVSLLRKEEIDNIPEDYALAAALKDIPVLARLSERDRAKLGGALKERHFADEQLIIRQGDVGNEFFLIRTGECIITHKADNGTEKEIARLHDGDYFGETALISRQKRGATVTASGAVTCLSMDSKTFRSLFSQQRLNVTFAKRNAVSSEAFTAARGRLTPENAKRDKGDDTKQLIANAVKSNVLFSNLDEEQLSQIVNEMWCLEVQDGKSLITQGEPGDNFYVVERGHFEIFVRKDGKSKLVATRGAGSSFGELALMYNSPRAATVTATTESLVWAVDRYMFRKILMRVSEDKLNEFEEFLTEVDLLSSLLTNERKQVAEALEEVTFKKGDTVVQQGDDGDIFYIIRKGTGVVHKREDGESQAKEVMQLRKGDFFGERALLTKEKRAATVKVTSSSMDCLCLDREGFTLLLGPLGDILKRNLERYEKPDEEFDRQPAMLDVKREHLTILGTLGKGSFGHVQLVRDKKTNDTFALKSVAKAQVVQLGQQDHILSEKRVMAKLNNRFLVRLFQTYKTRDCLYFLLEVVLGGELFSVLRNRTVFDEHTARFYAGSVVMAFEYMHERNIIYRDLKPENLLLDKKGYLKVTDFGFAKTVKDRTWTLCGTPDYLAPEVVSGQGHGKGVDWWTLGILIYEMLASYPPFYDEDPMKTYAKIMHGNISFPKHFSREAVDLIQRLLHPKPTKRIGVGKGGVSSIKNHSWFNDFDWDALNRGKMQAPIIPDISHDEDLTNFEEYPEEDDSIPAYRDDGTGWDDDF